jgi:hypothetical protein
METKSPIPQFLLEKIAGESPKLAARLAEAGIGVPVSLDSEDVPRELLQAFAAAKPGPLTATAVDITKKSDE